MGLFFVSMKKYLYCLVVLNGPREYGNLFLRDSSFFPLLGGMDVFMPLKKTILHFVIVFLLFLVAG